MPDAFPIDEYPFPEDGQLDTYGFSDGVHGVTMEGVSEEGAKKLIADVLAAGFERSDETVYSDQIVGSYTKDDTRIDISWYGDGQLVYSITPADATSEDTN
ncbi:MAG: hypothetical protein Q3965_00855 [Rothia sp. (in: high G+C Gram-positive bacteria)]|nr:hypothetical protein [Rothia sp. (in: high G+C Gram-positive bacteria)]